MKKKKKKNPMDGREGKLEMDGAQIILGTITSFKIKWKPMSIENEIN